MGGGQTSFMDDQNGNLKRTLNYGGRTSAILKNRVFYWRTADMNPRMLALLGARWCVWLAAGAALPAGLAPAQNTQAASAPPVITLPDALARARQYGGQIQSAN